MTTTEQVAQLVADRGTQQALAVIFLAAFVVLGSVGINEYRQDKKLRRKEAEEKRRLDIERNDNYIKLIEKITNTVSQSSYVLDEFGKKIDEHQNYSTARLDNISDDLKDIKEDISVVSSMEDKMATKEGLEEVKDKVESLIQALE